MRGAGGTVRRLEKLRSFDEFLARRFPESRRNAYYLNSLAIPLTIKDIETAVHEIHHSATDCGWPQNEILDTAYLQGLSFRAV